MKLYNEFISENVNNIIKLVHITTIDNANKIKENGFNIEPFIQYKYYSSLGKDGIYFYDDEYWSYKLIQQYAYFLQSKINMDKIALIHVTAPINIIKRNNIKEDGVFINKDDLNKIKIINVEFKKPQDIW